MKKSLLALAVLGAFTATASAQSSVTLYGNIDINARYTKNGDDSIKSLGNNGISSSAFGVRGTEDLGGGLSVGFQLEGDVGPDNGTANGAKFWGRTSILSLTSTSFGQVRLGRDYTPTFRGFAGYDPFLTNGVANHAGMFTTLGTGATTLVRADNSVAYVMPNMGGIYANAMIAAGEGTPGNKYFGGRVGYAAGPLDVSLSYGETEVVGDNEFTHFNLGAAYNFGMARLMGVYSRLETDLGADAEQDVWLIGATMPIGTAGSLRAAYSHTEVKNTQIEADRFAVGYWHSLSKRTTLYTNLARTSNEAGGTFASIGGPAIAPGDDSTGFEVGIKHSF